MLEPVGESAYDSLIPRSVAYRPTNKKGDIMPLVAAFREGALKKKPGWHRNEERAARGLPMVENKKDHLEAWEKQLVRTTKRDRMCCVSCDGACDKM